MIHARQTVVIVVISTATVIDWVFTSTCGQRRPSVSNDGGATLLYGGEVKGWVVVVVVVGRGVWAFYFVTENPDASLKFISQ